jgi:formylglycine-generating enzyme
MLPIRTGNLLGWPILSICVLALLPWLAQEKRKEEGAKESPKFEKEITNKVGMEFVLIKPGTFLMGSPEEEYERGRDETQHRVTLKKGYYLQKTLVSQQQWRAVMGEKNNPSQFKGNDLPVDTVSWDDAKEFCAKLNKMEGKEYYRLPTEAEWEYAARAGTTTPFWQGATISVSQMNYNGECPYREKDPKEEYRAKTTTVRQLKPNPWGLYDMGGNLWQWCEDHFQNYPKENLVDPQTSQKPEGQLCGVLRGGCWFMNAARCRTASREMCCPGFKNTDAGFRVAFRPD